MRVDRTLLIALSLPMLVTPWLPAWDNSQLPAGWFEAGLVVMAAAVVEEVVFRGFLQGGLLRTVWGREKLIHASRANWVSSMLFALAHLWQHPAFLFPGYLLISLALGYFRERYGGIRVPVLLHGYFNLSLLYFHFPV